MTEKFEADESVFASKEFGELPPQCKIFYLLLCACADISGYCKGSELSHISSAVGGSEYMFCITALEYAGLITPEKDGDGIQIITFEDDISSDGYPNEDISDEAVKKSAAAVIAGCKRAMNDRNFPLPDNSSKLTEILGHILLAAFIAYICEVYNGDEHSTLFVLDALGDMEKDETVNPYNPVAVKFSQLGEEYLYAHKKTSIAAQSFTDFITAVPDIKSYKKAVAFCRRAVLSYMLITGSDDIACGTRKRKGDIV